LVQALTALRRKSLFFSSLSADPSCKVAIVAILFVALFHQAMAFTVMEALQRRKAFLPLLRKCVPDEPYIF